MRPKIESCLTFLEEEIQLLDKQKLEEDTLEHIVRKEKPSMPKIVQKDGRSVSNYKKEEIKVESEVGNPIKDEGIYRDLKEIVGDTQHSWVQIDKS